MVNKMKKLLALLFIFELNFYCFSQINKKVIVSETDTSTWYKWTKEFNKKNDLVDLTKTRDSLYIRLSVGSICTMNNIYELKFDKNEWKGRVICHSVIEPRRFVLGFILFNQYHEYKCKKKKKLVYFEQANLIPIDTGNCHYSWDSIHIKLNELNLMQLKTQHEADTSKSMVEDGIWFEIEISTPSEYKYLAWANPKYSSKSFDVYAIQELYNLFCDKLEWKRNKLKPYRKNKWPK